MAEFAGPEVLTFAELSAQWLEATGRRPRRMLSVPVPGALGRAFKSGQAMPASGELGARTWRSWLARRYHHQIPE